MSINEELIVKVKIIKESYFDRSQKKYTTTKPKAKGVIDKTRPPAEVDRLKYIQARDPYEPEEFEHEFSGVREVEAVVLPSSISELWDPDFDPVPFFRNLDSWYLQRRKKNGKASGYISDVKAEDGSEYDGGSRAIIYFQVRHDELQHNKKRPAGAKDWGGYGGPDWDVEYVEERKVYKIKEDVSKSFAGVELEIDQKVTDAALKILVGGESFDKAETEDKEAMIDRMKRFVGKYVDLNKDEFYGDRGDIVLSLTSELKEWLAGKGGKQRGRVAASLVARLNKSSQTEGVLPIKEFTKLPTIKDGEWVFTTSGATESGERLMWKYDELVKIEGIYDYSDASRVGYEDLVFGYYIRAYLHILSEPMVRGKRNTPIKWEFQTGIIKGQNPNSIQDDQIKKMKTYITPAGRARKEMEDEAAFRKTLRYSPRQRRTVKESKVKIKVIK